MRLHLGTTANSGELAFMTNRYAINGAWTKIWTVHPVAKMWGISFGGYLFIGFMTFSETETRREKAP